MSEATVAQLELLQAQSLEAAAQAEVRRAQTAACAQQLHDVAGAAKTWGQTLTALFGLGGILAILQGEARLADLPHVAQGGAVVLLIGAFALGVCSIYE